METLFSDQKARRAPRVADTVFSVNNRIFFPLVLLGLWIGGDRGQGPYRPQLVDTKLGIPFDRFTTLDKFGRKIVFYVSKPGPASAPLVLIVLGSGGQSIWQRVGDRVGGSYQSVLNREAGGRLRVVVVEKPGVEYCFQPPHPGTAEGCSEEFLQEHTLDRWCEANEAAVKACASIPGIDTKHVLAIGHSEGGIVVAKVAADCANVSHVAVLSGGGPNQLVDLQQLFGKDVLSQWQAIEAAPDSVSQFAWGHPYRRWSSFLKTSTTEQLLLSKAKIFMAAGSEDKSVPVSSFLKAKADLKARGRSFVDLLVEGADHGFAKPEEQGKPSGFAAVLDKVIDWYFAKEPTK